MVNIRRTGESFSGDDDRVLVVGGEGSVRVEWSGNSEIRIYAELCDGDTVYAQEKRWQDVAVHLETGPGESCDQ
jgi:hypothetical protein